MKRTILADASNREEWLKARASRITGSDVAVMMRISEKFKSYNELLAEKASGSRGEIPDNSNMLWGRALEEPIAQVFADSLRCRWRPCHLLIGHGNGEKLAATLDGIFTVDHRYSEDDVVEVASRYNGRFGVDEWMKDFRRKASALNQQFGPGVLEIKNTSIFGTTAWNQEIPDYYIPQVQHQLLCTGKKWGAIVACLGGSNLMGHIYTADEEFQASIVKSADSFWKEVGGMI